MLLKGFGRLFLFIFLTEALPLSALAQPDVFSADQRAQYYLNLIPQEQQLESTIDLAEYSTFQQSCFQSAYGSWARSMKSSDEIAQRDSFLISKLNRPFYFQYVPRNDSKLHIIGNLDDFREMICIHLVLNGGKTADEAATPVSPGFVNAVLRSSNINSQVLDLMLALWGRGDRDEQSGRVIVAHSLFNQFNLRDFIGFLFKKPMAINERMPLLEAMLNTNAYLDHAREFFSLLLSESSNFISAEERFMMSQILIKAKKVDITALLNFATFEVDPSKDYTDLYLQFSKGLAMDGQFHVLSTMLSAGVNLPNSDAIFLEIWRQSSDRNLKDSMMAFAQTGLVKSKGLSRDTIHRVTLENLSEASVSAKTINMTLSNYRRGDESSPETKLNVLRRLGQHQESFDANSAENFINMATELRTADPVVEDRITDAVSGLGMRFRQNDLVLTAYVRYLKNMNNKKAEILLVQKILPEPHIDEGDLLLIADRTFDSGNETSYAFLEMMLNQPQISSRGLSELADLVRPTKFLNLKPDLSEGARKILILILGHAKSTDQIRQQVDRYLNPTIKFIVDPSPKN